MENFPTAESSIEKTKKCPRCGFEGALSNFPTDRSLKFGVRPECRVCYRVDRRKWNAAWTPEQRRKKHKRQIARHKERYHSDPEFKKYVNRKCRETENRRKFGLEPDDITKMLESQDHRCRICGRDISVRRNIDHCHDTNRVRGLLCGSCNRGIGLLQDSPGMAMNAILHMCRGTVE